MLPPSLVFFFFFNDTATTEIYTLSLHDALPIWLDHIHPPSSNTPDPSYLRSVPIRRSEEHTSELQSLTNLVCRLLLEKEKRTVRWWPRGAGAGTLRRRRVRCAAPPRRPPPPRPPHPRGTPAPAGPGSVLFFYEGAPPRPPPPCPPAGSPV